MQPRDRHVLRHRRAALPTVVIAAALAASQLGVTDCGGGITRDPGFDLWCGDSLCAWKLEHGDVQRISTWHEADSGVELLAPGTAIEQFTPVDSGDGQCVRFDLVTDLEDTAQVVLAVDVYGDGTIEHTFELPAAHWKPLSYAMLVKAPFTGIRFELTKYGAGRAALARMHATASPTYNDGCSGAVILDGGPAPLGALCSQNSQCASSICNLIDQRDPRRCTGCDPRVANACTGGEVCGYTDPGPPERSVPIACVAAGQRALGEQCRSSAECATSACNQFVCSTCLADTSCGGARCLRAYDNGPFLCAAGQHLAAPGAPCAGNDDCASRSCRGAVRRQCLDGRACATDDDCPVDASLVPGRCSAVGVQGGSCD